MRVGAVISNWNTAVFIISAVAFGISQISLAKCLWESRIMMNYTNSSLSLGRHINQMHTAHHHNLLCVRGARAGEHFNFNHFQEYNPNIFLKLPASRCYNSVEQGCHMVQLL
jgi:hypothetical protein